MEIEFNSLVVFFVLCLRGNLSPTLLVNFVQQMMAKYLAQPGCWAQHVDYRLHLHCALVQRQSQCSKAGSPPKRY